MWIYTNMAGGSTWIYANLIDARFPYLKQSLPENAALPLISEAESIARLFHESLGCDLLSHCKFIKGPFRGW
jgi:hypothetical protein